MTVFTARQTEGTNKTFWMFCTDQHGWIWAANNHIKGIIYGQVGTPGVDHCIHCAACGKKIETEQKVCAMHDGTPCPALDVRQTLNYQKGTKLLLAMNLGPMLTEYALDIFDSAALMTPTGDWHAWTKIAIQFTNLEVDRIIADKNPPTE